MLTLCRHVIACYAPPAPALNAARTFPSTIVAHRSPLLPTRLFGADRCYDGSFLVKLRKSLLSMPSLLSIKPSKTRVIHRYVLFETDPSCFLINWISSPLPLWIDEGRGPCIRLGRSADAKTYPDVLPQAGVAPGGRQIGYRCTQKGLRLAAQRLMKLDILP
jgi:hypothetical protein